MEGLVFLASTSPASGRRTPIPTARGAFVGLSLRHDRGALVRAVLEGVAYGLRDCLEVLGARSAARSPVGRASGGGARSALWLRIVASVLGLPLERTVAEEGAAYGAALLGGVAGVPFRRRPRGGGRLRACPATVEPVAEWVDAYADGYARFRELYPQLAPLRP